MSYINILEENVKKEFADFKSKQLNLNPEQIFDNACRIHFYKEIYNYIIGNDFSEDYNWRDIKKLAICSQIISLLYDEYLSKEHLSVDNWECIREIIESFLDERSNI